MTPAPRETLAASDIRRTDGPFVYGWRRNGRYRYIGATRRGLPRLVGRHHAIIAGGGLRPDDAIDIWTTDGDVFELEAALIREHRPELNRALVAAPREVDITPPATTRRAPQGRNWPPERETVTSITVAVEIIYGHGPILRGGRAIGDTNRFALTDAVIRHSAEFDAILDATARLEDAAEEIQALIYSAATIRRDGETWRSIETDEVVDPPACVVESAPALENIDEWLRCLENPPVTYWGAPEVSRETSGAAS